MHPYSDMKRAGYNLLLQCCDNMETTVKRFFILN